MREVDWQTSPGLVPYPAGVAAMENRVDAIRRNAAPDLVWCLEHPPLYTAGTSASDGDLIDPRGLPVYRSGRGGQITYHGPGQRVVYLMLDLRRLPGTNGPDVRTYVRRLEAWLIGTLADLGVTGERREGRVGIWVPMPGGDEAKIAAIGVRIRHWIAFHGVALNVDPDLGHYAGIVPCGIRDHGVTSLAALGRTADMARVDALLRDNFAATFGLRPCPRTAELS